ncbi:MAG: YbiU family protein, partial [Paracoccaceae bacterium]
QEIDALLDEIANGGSGIPELPYASIESKSVSPDQFAEIRQKGCVIIRGVFERKRAEIWNAELGEYIEANDYFTKAREKAGLDKYFSHLKDAVPQIFGIYWSKPQVMARQDPAMAETKAFLNGLWDVRAPMGDEFDPSLDYAYADRTRRRQPGDTTLGLSPHMDAGSYERWVDPAFQAVYAAVFEGHWQAYNPWKAAYRTQTREFSSPAVASMFRTFQGWTGLTEQGPNGGTLQLVPTTMSMPYMLLRALQEDVAEDDLCGAQPGRALGADQSHHAELLRGLTTIPTVYPGDTVWWHTDIIHAVEQANLSRNWANVIYIGASPACKKNQTYAALQARAFVAGKSAPDFAPEDYEVDFRGRATLDDLTPLGRKQMGF